jgi:hypothetical protein
MEAARKIQRAWRRTSTRLGRLGTAFNENAPMNQLRNVPLSRLYKILLYIARRHDQDWRYNMRPNGLYYTSGVGPHVRMTRPMVIQNIGQWTNLRTSPRKNQAAQTIQKYRRAQMMKRRLALMGSIRETPLTLNLRRRIFSV